jgi:hypothetical protein
MSTTNVPFGPGYDEASSTSLANQLAKLCDDLHTLAAYATDTYSPYTADDIAQTWANLAVVQIPPVTDATPTPEQTEKANEFKSWLDTVFTMIDAAYGSGADVGFQIRKWRAGAPQPR